MAEQISVELSEVIVALMQHLGLHEGIWGLNVEFGMGVGNFGTSKEEARPSAFVQVLKLGLAHTKIEGPLALDASKVNPGPGNKPSAKPAAATRKTSAKPAATRKRSAKPEGAKRTR